MIDFLSGSDAALFSFDGGQGISAVRTFRKDTGLIPPEGTVKPTAPAFRADALIAAVIVVGAGCLLHEQIKGLQISGCHVAHFQNSFLRRFAVICKWQTLPAFGQQKKRVCFLLRNGERNKPSSFTIV